jgi:hypothetical protein
MVIHAIASYNISWMGDRGKIIPFASEKHLYTNQTVPNSREYFLNTISNALHFWKTIDDSSIISFQEVNDQDYVKKSDPSFIGGFQFIIKVFKDNTVKGDLESSSFCIQSGSAQPCLLTLWKKSKLGSKLFEFGDDIIFDVNGHIQTGRPMSIVLTDKNYYLINLHGPNHGSESNIGMPQLRNAINRLLNIAQSKFGSSIEPFEPKKVIIMGDFNDPYRGINVFNKLNIKGYEYTFGNILAPMSCCYNFVSSCNSSIYGILSEQQQHTHSDLLMYDPLQGDKLYMNPNECAIVYNDTTPSRDMRLGLESHPRSLGKRGELANYKFTGDYCFTYVYNTIIQPLTIYRSVHYADGVSHESDHEMVMLIFDDGVNVGALQKRVSRRKSK